MLVYNFRSLKIFPRALLAYSVGDPLPPSAATAWPPPLQPLARARPTAGLHPPLHPQVAAIAAATNEVNDEFCPDSSFFRYLQEQKRIRENELAKLTQEYHLGFNPKNTRRPF